MTALDQHIVITHGIASGKPRIAGHRMVYENSEKKDF